MEPTQSPATCTKTKGPQPNYELPSSLAIYPILAYLSNDNRMRSLRRVNKEEEEVYDNKQWVESWPAKHESRE